MDHIYDWALVETCGACPEQYDLLRDGEQVGYFRLRHGFYYVETPWVGGETVFTAHPQGDGIFMDDERVPMLRQGVKAVLKALGVPKPMRKQLAQEIVEARRPGSVRSYVI